VNVNSEMINQYSSMLGEDMDITIEFVDQILPTRAGERRLVISNLPAKSEHNSGLLLPNSPVTPHAQRAGSRELFKGNSNVQTGCPIK